jgi:hypothetical protein
MKITRRQLRRLIESTVNESYDRYSQYGLDMLETLVYNAFVEEAQYMNASRRDVKATVDRGMKRLEG